VLSEEDAVNEMQIEIDERIQRLLALQAPMAADLRFLLAVSRINGDLERIGDRPSTCAIRHAGSSPSASEALRGLPRMSELAEGMFATAECAGSRRSGTRAERAPTRRSGRPLARPDVPRTAHLHDGNSSVVFSAFELVLVAKISNAW